MNASVSTSNNHVQVKANYLPRAGQLSSVPEQTRKSGMENG